MCYLHVSRTVSPMDFKLGRCLATGMSKCSAKFDVVWIRNAKDIVKYTVSWHASVMNDNAWCFSHIITSAVS